MEGMSSSSRRTHLVAHVEVCGSAGGKMVCTRLGRLVDGVAVGLQRPRVVLIHEQRVGPLEQLYTTRRTPHHKRLNTHTTGGGVRLELELKKNMDNIKMRRLAPLN
jgi:hypothetical protein